MNIHTPRLELIPATADLLRLEINDPSTLGKKLGATIPANWPPEEVKDMLEFFAKAMDAGVTGDGWGIYYWVARTGEALPRVLVGSGGFKGKPSEGMVEIGYGTLNEFQGRGYATEAVRALTAMALSHARVSRVVADALPENVASVRVLLKGGFAETGAGEEEGTRRFEFSGDTMGTAPASA